jgi:hypothetical protein
MTIEFCINFCGSKGYIYAGTEFGVSVKNLFGRGSTSFPFPSLCPLISSLGSLVSNEGSFVRLFRTIRHSDATPYLLFSNFGTWQNLTNDIILFSLSTQAECCMYLSIFPSLLIPEELIKMLLFSLWCFEFLLLCCSHRTFTCDVFTRTYFFCSYSPSSKPLLFFDTHFLWHIPSPYFPIHPILPASLLSPSILILIHLYDYPYPY